MQGVSALIGVSLLLLVVATFLSRGAGDKIAVGMRPDFEKLLNFEVFLAP